MVAGESLPLLRFLAFWLIVVVAPDGALDERNSTNSSFQLKPFGERVRLGEIYKSPVGRFDLVQRL
jgi:hypothetical protein